MNFFCFSGNKVNIQGVSTDEAARKSVHKFLQEFAMFVFDAYYINLCVKFDDIFLTASERKGLSMCQLSKNSSS